MARAPALRAWLLGQIESHQGLNNTKSGWTTRRVLDRVFDLTQAEIVRLRTERQPPDLLLTPMVGDVGVLEFYRAKEAIAAGRRAAEERLADIQQLVRRAS